MPDMIRQNYKLDLAIKLGEKDVIQREAQKMRYYADMDKEDYGKFLMFIERLIGGYRGRAGR